MEELVEALQERCELREGLLQQLAGWCDLEEQESTLLLGVLERFHLVVRQGPGARLRRDQGEASWLCVCRLVGSADRAEVTEADWSAYENETRVRVSYALDYLAPPVFARFIAMQLSSEDTEIEDMDPPRADMLRLRLRRRAGEVGTDGVMVTMHEGDRGGTWCGWRRRMRWCCASCAARWRG